MHAGEALWTLYAFAVHLERRNKGKPSVINKVVKCTEACQILAAHMSYPLPTGEMLDKWVETFEAPPKADADNGETNTQPQDKPSNTGGASKASNLDLDEARLTINRCKDLLKDIDSDSDAAADYVSRTLDKLEKIEEGMDKYNNLLDWQKQYLEELPDKIGRWIH